MAELEELKPESELHRHRLPLYLFACILSVWPCDIKNQEFIFTFRSASRCQEPQISPHRSATGWRGEMCSFHPMYTAGSQRSAADLCLDRTTQIRKNQRASLVCRPNSWKN